MRSLISVYLCVFFITPNRGKCIETIKELCFWVVDKCILNI